MKKISVLIATHNRSEILRQTLNNFTELDMTDLSVEIVIVDNNSVDNTPEVIDSFKDRLPLVYLFEQRPGKNCALNKALREVDLGDLVVFTDDDVKPNEDWLQAIWSVSMKRHDYSVFGGVIIPLWPQVQIPDWIKVDTQIRILCYAEHDFGDKEADYKTLGGYPYGPNYWVRKEVFQGERFFNEDIGPRPKDRIMGSETSFLKRLKEDGYAMLYSPDAVVQHYVTEKQLSDKYLLKRAVTKGKSIAFLGPFRSKPLYDKFRPLWYFLRVCSLIKQCCRYLFSYLLLTHAKRMRLAMDALTYIGYNSFYLRRAQFKLSIEKKDTNYQ